MKKIYLLLCCMTALTAFGQIDSIFSGNGKTGFGGTVGNGSLKITENAGVLTFEFTRGTDNFNNAIVIYIDSKSGGITSTSGLTDAADGLRKAISGFDGTNRTTLNFPSPFEPDYALAFMPGGGVSFGGFWDLFTSSSNLNYIKSANLNSSSSQTDATYTVSINTADLNLEGGSQTFGFLANYISPTAYRSNESFGDAGPSANPGSTGNYDATTYALFNFGSVPVTLSNFTASANNTSVNLQWSTSQESNMDSYEIWRSADGNDFSKIGSVAALNNPLSQEYNFEDAHPSAGNNYYKLAMVGKDGKVSFSKVVSVKASSAVAFKAYTTSSNRVLKIELNDAGSGNLLIEMSNSVGQKIFQTQINSNGTNQYSVDLHKTLATGIYAVTISKDGEKYSKMIMVK